MFFREIFAAADQRTYCYGMGQELNKLMHTLNRIDSHLDVQWGRASLMQRWLDDHSERLDNLSVTIDASLARMDALLNYRGTRS